MVESVSAHTFGSPAADTAFRSALDVVRAVEPRIAAAISGELTDQRASLKLIASENYASPAVLLAMGNWLSDKYAEGTPGRRFYAGCRNVDTVEELAAEHARELFGAEHAYVQPHSGIDANLVAFWAVLSQRVESPALRRAGVRNVNDLSEQDWAELRRELGNQRMLGMSLDAGGHLTHGFRPNISGKMFDQRSYGTDPATGLVDYDEVRRIALEFKPLILVAGYSAYPRLVNFRRMREIADEVGATLMVDMAHFAGLVAGKVLTGDFDPVAHAQIVTTTTHKSLRGPRGGMVLCTSELAEHVDRGCPLVLGGPLSHVMAAKAVAFAEARRPEFQVYARQVVDNARALAEGLLARGATLVTGGTDNHLVLADVSSYGLTGRQAEAALLDSGIVTNRNAVPQDPNGAWYTSGIRLGTPALTTRGLGAAELDEVAELIHTVLTATTPVGSSKAQYALDGAVRDSVAKRAVDLLADHPLYPGIALG
ncbi:glycine hydroxymethyltransferase [Kitasatospora saccharophila]|uniref:glycine hydroxymethyltransferase n=1 Tax=Kitasatospora saccharophila TaxID=407973 RepID=UPI0031D567E0